MKRKRPNPPSIAELSAKRQAKGLRISRKGIKKWGLLALVSLVFPLLMEEGMPLYSVRPILVWPVRILFTGLWMIFLMYLASYLLEKFLPLEKFGVKAKEESNDHLAGNHFGCDKKK